VRDRSRRPIRRDGRSAALGIRRSQPVSVFGDATEIAEAARQWSDAGATSVVMQPAADVDIHDFVGFIGSQVQPLLAR
jgi:hypothetical protein